jgi:hypothetical protein
MIKLVFGHIFKNRTAAALANMIALFVYIWLNCRSTLLGYLRPFKKVQSPPENENETALSESETRYLT